MEQQSTARTIEISSTTTASPTKEEKESRRYALQIHHSSRHPIPKSRCMDSKFGSASGTIDVEQCQVLEGGNNDFDKALCDLGASVNLMPYSTFEKLGMHELTSIIIPLQLADRSIKYPRGIVEDVLVKVGKFIIPVDFFVLDMEKDKNMPLILGRPLLATSQALIDVQKGQLTFRINDEHVVFNVFKPMKYLCKNEHDIFAIDNINATRTDNVHLVKYENLKVDCIENSNGDNLQSMKEKLEDVPSFIDIGQEVQSKLQKVLLLNGSTSNKKVQPPFEASFDRKKTCEDKWGRPNRMKRWRNQVYENVGFYKDQTKEWNGFHMRKKKNQEW
ncbi:UNVERIFIED_CONTAM: hypothetical protein Scaly_0477800 [Sesamum calycinum]|uniref:Uncharacterized protein n=1 Tax=Sesamum calycinum TaxID=2727403 RepID=A0AAW2SGN0_9LAMI